MRKLLLYLMLFSACSFVRAENIYIVGTTQECQIQAPDGFSLYICSPESFTKEPTKRYYIRSEEKDYEICLTYYNFKDSNVNLEILSLPISALNNLETVIEAEELMQFATADMAYNWMINHLENKTKIYIIDRRDFYKSDPDLAVPNMMKVVEVEIWYEDIPDHIKGSVPILK